MVFVLPESRLILGRFGSSFAMIPNVCETYGVLLTKFLEFSAGSKNLYLRRKI